MKQKNLVLMGVAVGCGLVAAILTSQMSGKSAAPEQVDVIVASRDIPIGTYLSNEEIEKSFTTQKMNKDAVPVGIVETKEEMLEQRTTREFTKGETIKKGELSKFAVVKIPEGKRLWTLPMTVAQGGGGFVFPGNRVDIYASMGLKNNKRKAIMILSDVLVLAIDTTPRQPKEGGAFQSISTMSFALDDKEIKLSTLALDRGCQLRISLRGPNELGKDPSYNAEEVVKVLQDPEGEHETGGTSSEGGSDTGNVKPVEIPKQPENPPSAPSVVKVRVVVAKADLPQDLQLTADLVKDPEKFTTIEMEEATAKNMGAVTDLTPYVGKYLKTGLHENQPVTDKLLANNPQPKPSPRNEFMPERPNPETPRAVDPMDEPAPRVKRPTHDMWVVTPQGYKLYRYEEVRPGEWKLLGTVNPYERAKNEPAPKNDPVPKPAPSGQKID